MKDDRDLLLEKIDGSDGVIFATPNYSFQVSGVTKLFLDRIAFIFHRPWFFGKVFSNIVVQGIYGGNKINKYLDFVGDGLGFNTVKGICLTALEPVSDFSKKRMIKLLKNQAVYFMKNLKNRRLRFRHFLS